MDFNISSYLAKYKNLTPPDDFLKRTFISAVKEETNIVLQQKDIRVERGIIHLVAAPTIKSELYIKKPLLLKRLRGILQKERVTDIR